MQLKTSLLFLAGLVPFGLALPHAIEQRDQYVSHGFGGRSKAAVGANVDLYKGNVGNPWGSNIIEISADKADKYKYVVEVSGKNKKPWNVVFWNKYGPSGKLDGHYGNSALSFSLGPGETKHIAFDENSQVSMGAAPSDLPKGNYGGYSCTWGEFDFGNTSNNGCSGFDVSAIQAMLSGHDVQGMKICDESSGVCSAVSTGGKVVDNAYTDGEIDIGGIGGNLQAGAVRLSVVIDYDG
ncbi:hypothetical protein AJ80_09776 [Polytolypa hystricis UAMH7299]|uniref:Allergen Asp f 4 n=1 Tax=Polytolypa hystricis (strain UAMH7299) TaxID=1447883 RepID=A0A2B7WJP4_POLH7|nr:hypothetical protein AJ80_09776 [Polytolypa hystricis UAMH7299]